MMNHTQADRNQPNTTPAGLALAGVVSIGAVLLTLAAGWGMSQAQQRFTPSDESTVLPTSEKPAGALLNGADYLAGRELYNAACSACHGANGQGVANMGKDLVRGKFPLALSDTGLAKQIIAGRPVTDPMNTTKIPMPPKGGRADLTDAQIGQIVVYIRGLQDPRRIPADLPEQAPTMLLASNRPGSAPATNDIVDPTASGYEASWVLEGRALYQSSCVSCHGADARGLPNLGKDLAQSGFVAKLDDEQMIAFLKKGRPVSDPENTTKVDMPPKGGNPALDDEKLESITVYLREVQALAAKSH